MRRRVRLNLQVFLTNKCNLACRYCFQHHSEQSFDFAAFAKSVKYLRSYLRPSELSVMFCGGEPFLEFEKIREIVDFFTREFEGIPMIFYLTTNGTLFTSRIIKYVLDKNIDVSVSIDGERDLHNENRVFLNGQGTFDRVDENMKLLRNNGVSPHIKTVVSDFRTVKDTYMFIRKQWNPKTLFISEYIGKDVVTKTQQELSLYSSLWHEIIDLELDSFCKDGKWTLVRFSALLKRLFSKDRNLAFCDAGNGTYCVFLNGDIYPCYRASEYPEFRLDVGSIKNAGNYFTEAVSKKINEICFNCSIKQLCGGGCAINSYEFGGCIGSIYKPDCQMHQMYSELTLYLLGRITKFSFDEIKRILGINGTL